MKKNKKIAIASYWDSESNYGQILQGVALQYVLKDLGYEPFTIKYDVSASDPHNRSLKDKIYEIFHDNISLFEHIKRRIKTIGNRTTSSHTGRKEYIDRKFDEFRKKHLELSQYSYSSFEELTTKEISDCYALITGSDQVWTAASGPQRRKYFLLEFAKKGQKRISYAASFGRNYIIHSEEQEEYKKELALFDAISVREDSGIQLCKVLGRNAICLSDPTLLLTKEEWMSHIGFSDTKSRKKKKAFIYTLTANHGLVNKIINQLTSLGYEYDFVCSDDNCIDPKENLSASPTQWLEVLSKADIVITTSFHGTIFALNFNVPVLSIGKMGALTNGQNQRMYSIMNKLGLLDFFVNEFDKNTLEQILSSKIDWEYVNDIIKAERNRSIRFIQNTLN